MMATDLYLILYDFWLMFGYNGLNMLNFDQDESYIIFQVRRNIINTKRKYKNNLCG